MARSSFFQGPTHGRAAAKRSGPRAGPAKNMGEGPGQRQEFPRQMGKGPARVSNIGKGLGQCPGHSKTNGEEPGKGPVFLNVLGKGRSRGLNLRK